MVVTREMLIKKLSAESGYYQRDIRKVLRCLDTVVAESFKDVTANEDVSVQLLTGVKLSCSVIPERERVDPRTQAPIICGETCKIKSKISEEYKAKIQNQYEDKKNGN